MAASKRETEIAQALLEHGARLDMADVQGRTPLVAALAARDAALAHTLLAAHEAAQVPLAPPHVRAQLVAACRGTLGHAALAAQLAARAGITREEVAAASVQNWFRQHLRRRAWVGHQRERHERVVRLQACARRWLAQRGCAERVQARAHTQAWQAALALQRASQDSDIAPPVTQLRLALAQLDDGAAMLWALGQYALDHPAGRLLELLLQHFGKALAVQGFLPRVLRERPEQAEDVLQAVAGSAACAALVDTPDSNEQTALMTAGHRGMTAVGRQLLELGANVNAQASSTQETVMHACLRGAHFELLELVLTHPQFERAAHAHWPGEQGPVEVCACLGRADVAQMLTATLGFARPGLDRYVLTSLCAVRSTTPADLDMFRQLGYSAGEYDPTRKQSPLLSAVAANNLPLVKALLQDPAVSLLVVGSSSQTVYHYATRQNGDLEMLETLFEARVAAVQAALSAQDYEAVSKLSGHLMGLEDAGSVNSPMSYALSGGKYDLALFFVRKGAVITSSHLTNIFRADPSLACVRELQLLAVERETRRAVTQLQRGDGTAALTRAANVLAALRERGLAEGSLPAEVEALLDTPALVALVLTQLKARSTYATKLVKSLPWADEQSARHYQAHGYLQELVAQAAGSSGCRLALRDIMQVLPTALVAELALPLACRVHLFSIGQSTFDMLHILFTRCPQHVAEMQAMLLAQDQFLRKIFEHQTKKDVKLRHLASTLACRFFPSYAIFCEICTGLCDPVELVRVDSGGEHFRKPACSHAYCGPCLQQYLQVAVDGMALNIRCPHPDCKFVLYPDDVKRLAAPDTFERYDALRKTDYRTRLRQLQADGLVNSEFLKQTRVCPACYVIIERSEGCDSMFCVCGNSFRYKSAVDPMAMLQKQEQAS